MAAAGSEVAHSIFGGKANHNRALLEYFFMNRLSDEAAYPTNYIMYLLCTRKLRVCLTVTVTYVYC